MYICSKELGMNQPNLPAPIPASSHSPPYFRKAHMTCREPREAYASALAGATADAADAAVAAASAASAAVAAAGADADAAAVAAADGAAACLPSSWSTTEGLNA